MIPLAFAQIYCAAIKAWSNSHLDIPFAEWLEKQKLAGLYWGA